MKYLTMSRELLKHFQCGNCKKWWTAGDAPEEKKEWYCPWCGNLGKLETEKGNVVIGGTYKHYKGHVYRVTGIAKHSETQEELVVYERINGNFAEEIWARPKMMFLEKVVVAGKKISRFKFLKKQV